MASLEFLASMGTLMANSAQANQKEGK